MTIGLPGWLTWLGDKMGEKFPDGDEDALRRLAQQFREVADGLESESLSSTRTAISTALDNIEGRTREAMETEYSSLTSGDASIQTLVSQVRSLADGLENMGTEVQFTKEMYIANLIVLAATIVTLMATAWLNWSAPAEVAVAITATRAVITRLVLETLGRIVSEQVARVIADMAFNMVVGAALNTAISSGMDLAVQGIQNLQGTRHGIDWGRVGADAESAAITGVLAGGVGAGLGRIAPNVDGVIRNYAQGVVANTAGMVGAQEITTGHVDLGSAVQAGMVFGGVDALGRSLHANTPDTAGEQPNSVLAEGELSPDLMAELHRGGASVDTAGDTAGAHPESGTSATGPENHEAGDSTAPGVQESTGGTDSGGRATESAPHPLSDAGAGDRGAASGASAAGPAVASTASSASGSGTATAGDARSAGVAPRTDASPRPSASLTSGADGARSGGGAGTPVARIADSPVTPVTRSEPAVGAVPPEGERGTPVTDVGGAQPAPTPTHVGSDEPAPGPGDPRAANTPTADESGGPSGTTAEPDDRAGSAGTPPPATPAPDAPPGRAHSTETAADSERSGGTSRDTAQVSKDPARQPESAKKAPEPRTQEPRPSGVSEELGRPQASDIDGGRPSHSAGEPVATAKGDGGNPQAGSDVTDRGLVEGGAAPDGHAAAHDPYEPESGAETCAADVLDYLSETTGHEFVLPNEPTAEGIAARDLFEAIGSEALPDSYARIHDTLLDLGDGAQALIASRWAGDAEGLGGHAYVAVNDGGAVHLVDPVTGARSGWPPHWGEENVGIVVAGYFHPHGTAVHPLFGEAGLHAALEVGEVGAGPRSRWIDPGRGEPVSVIERRDLGVGVDGTPVRERIFDEWTARIEPKLDPDGLGTEHADYREVARHERELEYPVGAHPVYPENRVIETVTGVGGNELTLTTAFGENGLEVPVGGKVVIGEVFDRVDRPGAEVAAQREAARGQGVQEVCDTDQGGHVFGFRFVLAQGLRNMFAQDGHFNMTPYRVMENEWSDFARYGARVEVEIKLKAPVVGERPEVVIVAGRAYSAASGRPLQGVKLGDTFGNKSRQTYTRQYYKREILSRIERADAK
ncbi:MAG TPA: hypothetical protein DIW80_05470 [Gordonia polyisoprenivorans]|uniref:WXG100-like domain-containing protein n=1 Tax=Gordonia polyisoprenivorans TaxID=84595 RepID=UPI00037A3CD8|nr:toxin glutamine deamidase domain-containing protein [Gordonia polyisoprenivorans]HCS56765.1 hypothetical protein [Gordonia polyisoprenivorans]